MDPKILREAALAYQAVYNEDLREEIEEDQLALEIIEAVAYTLISQGCNAIDVLEYFANVDDEVIIEDLVALSDGSLILESVVSEEYIEQQLDEVLGLIARGASALARPALNLAAKAAPRIAGAVTKFGQRAATKASQLTWKSGAKSTPMGRFPAGTATAPGTKLIGQKNLLQRAGGAVTRAVNTAKDVARGALNKLPGGSKGRLANAARTVGNMALGGAAFGAADTAARRALSGGPKPQTAKPAPSTDKAKFNASAALGGKSAFAAGGGAAAMKKNPNLTAADIQKKGNEALFKAGGGDAARSKKNQTRSQIMAQGSKNVAASKAKPGSSATMNALNAPGVQNKFIQDKPASSSAPASRPSAPSAPASRPAATAPTAKPSPTASAPAKPSPAPSTPAAKPTKVQQDVADLKAMQTASQERQASPSSKEDQNKRRLGGSAKPGSIVSGFDMFDVVKGYLIDEGFAETEESAIAIMANMSEDWRMQIINETINSVGEVEQVDEVVGLLARAAIPAISAGLGGLAVLRARQAAQSGVDAAKSGAKVKPGAGIANVAHGLQRRNQMLDQYR